jgi:non-specific serine/threonine protein kinase
VIALRRNDNEAASELFLGALGRFRSLDDRWSVAVTTSNLGWIAEMENDLADARDWYDESRQIRGGVGDEYTFAKSTADLGRIARRRREPVVASKLLKQALHVFQRIGDRRLAAACLVELGAVAAQRRRWEMAARLLGAAESVRASLGMPAWPDEQTLHDEVLESIRTTRDDSSILKALRTGRALSLEDAVELVASGTWPPAYRRWTTSYPAEKLSAAAASP